MKKILIALLFGGFSVSVAFADESPERTGKSGFGVNWGNPSDRSLRHQYTGELFYRVQLAQNLAITPSVQLLIDPALNPDENALVVYGLRTRMAF